MFGLLSGLVLVVSTIVPLVFTIARIAPWVRRMIQIAWNASRGSGVGLRSGFWGAVLVLFSFAGGVTFLLSLYFGWGLQVYLKFLDIVFTPFSYVAENLISGFVSQLPSLPANSASVLCLFDFTRCFTLLVTGFCFEVYLRVLIYYWVRRRV